MMPASVTIGLHPEPLGLPRVSPPKPNRHLTIVSYTLHILSRNTRYKTDIWSVACVMFELITGGDYLFDPATGSRYSKDDDHIAQIMELVGEIPKSIAFSGKYSSEFFNRKGELRHINKLRYWPLDSVLHDKYLFPTSEAEELSAFLTPMLRLHPPSMVGWCRRSRRDRRHQESGARQKRPELAAADNDPNTAADEKEKASGESGSRSGERSRVVGTEKALTQSEADALKPVDVIENALAAAAASASTGSGPSSPVRPLPQVPKLTAMHNSTTAGAKENTARSTSGSGSGASQRSK